MTDGPETSLSAARTPPLARTRASDFRALAGIALIVLALLALMGQASWLGALLGGIAVATFAMLWFYGTVDPASEPPDDTDARRAARASAEQEKAFRVSLVEALPEPALYIDALGKVEAANAAARRTFRFLGAEPQLTAVVRRPELLDAVAAARKTGEAQRLEFTERGETDRYFACVAAPLGAGILVSMHDLTEIKRVEMARVDFLANASHELRTPLTSLSGFIETLRGPAREDAEARERFLEIMQTQADRMKRLISDLMSLSRIELAEHRPPEDETDLADVVNEVGEALAPVAAERDVTIRVSGAERPIPVTGVRDELAQVVQNLIDNAVKYSEPNGMVEVALAQGLTGDEAVMQAGRQWVEAGHMSIVSAAGRGPCVALRVTDAGPGIERQFLPRLSERFYRVDPGRGLRPGTGLGLAIVKHVVQRHRGSFLVESVPGRGSAFGVVLPMRGANDS
jgi:two-component system phosphate regulon sensor histidine kinase PhoR